MATIDLTNNEWHDLFESLRYTKQAFMDYAYYPSFEFKLQRVADIDRLIEKLKVAKQGA